ncbi:MAG: NERD domain-containing protein [Chloroflexota bacterium]
MNIYVHDEYMKEKASRAKRQQTIGMICIVVSFLFSFGSFGGTSTWLIFLAYPFLLVGFPLWTMGRSAQRKLSTSTHADVLLNAEMKGLNNKYSLHHYVRHGNGWIHHLLITPSGLIVMNSNDAASPVTCRGTEKGDQWKSPSNILDRMTGLKPPVGNPTQELETATAAARDLLNQIGKPNVPVKAAVLFTRNPDVTIDGCSFQGVPMNEAKLVVRELQQDMDNEREGDTDVKTILTSEDRRKLNLLLAPEDRTAPANPTPAKR